MTTELATTTTESDLVIALNPAQFAEGQKTVGEWIAEKERSLRARLTEWEFAKAKAIERKASSKLHSREISRIKSELNYYDKAGAACAEGFSMIPDFPMSTIAIRTMRSEPRYQTRDCSWHPIVNEPVSDGPKGEGKYVSPDVALISEEYEKADGRKGRNWETDHFQDVRFPVKFIKPRILDAAQEAMALKIFDEIGVLPNTRRKDPMLIGRIRGPKRKSMTFLIAWFVEKGDL